MSEIAEFPVGAAIVDVAPVYRVPPGGEDDDELLDLKGHTPPDALGWSAYLVEKPEDTSGGHSSTDSQSCDAVRGNEITDRGRSDLDALTCFAPVGDLCAQLQELQVRRRFWIKTITRQDNALGALARRALGWRYDMPEKEREKLNGRAATLVASLLAGREVKADDVEVAQALAADVGAAQAARAPMLAQRHAVELDMKRAVRKLPAAEWQRSVRGFGEMGFAVIVGEAGDLSNYPNPAKLWRRLGLAPYEGHAGKTWRIDSWRPRSLSSDEWSDYGYSGQRLAQVYGVVTEPLMKGCGGTVYRAVYDHAKASFADRARSPAHAHAHAMRLMTKALVLDLWRVWHGQPPRDRQLVSEDL